MNALGGVLLPSNFAALLFLAAAAAFLWQPIRRFARALLFGSAFVWFAFSNGLTATMLISPLEYEFPAVQNPSRYPEIRTIVVLTAYATEDPEMPLSSRLNSSAAFRVLETANLVAGCPDCTVIVSGGGVSAQVMAEQLRQLGIPADSLVVDAGAASTSASAMRLAGRLAGQRVFLVTSAGHMSRSVAVFQQQGISPIPAPTDYQLPRRIMNASWLPSAVHLHASDLAVHEYLGRIWYRLKGWA